MGNRIVSNNLLSALIEVDENSDGNVLTDNVTRGARRREGAYGSRGVRLVGASRTLFRGNRISGAPQVHAAATGTLLQNNEVHGFADDGIDVEAPGTVIRRNNAHDNGDLGIEAVAGVVDGGGNTASGNGNPLQCANVFCG